MDSDLSVCVLLCIASFAFAGFCFIYALRAFQKLRKAQQTQYQELLDESVQHWEREKYRERVTELELENRMLKSSLIAMNEGSRGSKTLQNEVQRMTRDVEAAQSREHALKQQNDVLARTLEDYKKVLRQTEAENTSLRHSMQEERNRSQQSIEPLMRRMQKTEEAYEKTKKQCKSLEDDLQAARKVREDSDRQLRSLSLQLEATINEISRLKQEAVVGSQQQAAFKAQIVQLQNRLAEEMKNDKPLKRQLQDVTERLMTAVARAQELEQVLAKDAQSAELLAMLEEERNRNAALESEFRVFTRAKDEDERIRECVVCLSAQKSVMFEPCRHCCTCRECGLRLVECPLCKRPIRRRKHVFV